MHQFLHDNDTILYIKLIGQILYALYFTVHNISWSLIVILYVHSKSLSLSVCLSLPPSPCYLSLSHDGGTLDDTISAPNMLKLHSIQPINKHKQTYHRETKGRKKRRGKLRQNNGKTYGYICEIKDILNVELAIQLHLSNIIIVTRFAILHQYNYKYIREG